MNNISSWWQSWNWNPDSRSVTALCCFHPIHREQSLLHIKKTYVCQKAYRSEAEIPLGSIWLRIGNQEDRYCENQPLSQMKEVEDGLQGRRLQWNSKHQRRACVPCPTLYGIHLNFTYPIREAPLLPPSLRWRNTYNLTKHTKWEVNTVLTCPRLGWRKAPIRIINNSAKTRDSQLPNLWWLTYSPRLFQKWNWFRVGLYLLNQ